MRIGQFLSGRGGYLEDWTGAGWLRTHHILRMLRHDLQREERCRKSQVRRADSLVEAFSRPRQPLPAFATLSGAVGVSLAAASGNPDASGEKHYSGICRANCTGQCLLDIIVRDGKVVKTAMGKHPNSDYNRICSKGLAHLQRLYGPRRIQYPMRRVGERGSGEWERITWDEAIAEICEKWTAIRKE